MFELLELNEDLANALRADDAVEFARQAKRQPGYRPLVLNALDFAIAGRTSIEEVLALSGQVEDLKLDAAETMNTQVDLGALTLQQNDEKRPQH